MQGHAMLLKTLVTSYLSDFEAVMSATASSLVKDCLRLKLEMKKAAKVVRLKHQASVEKGMEAAYFALLERK